MADTWYAWSDLQGGGDIMEVPTPPGGSRKVVTNRKVTRRGAKVNQADFKDDWDALVEGGSVRPYPLPEGSSDLVSPTTALVRQLVDDNGDIDPLKLLNLGITGQGGVIVPPGQMVTEEHLNPPAKAEKEAQK